MNGNAVGHNNIKAEMLKYMRTFKVHNMQYCLEGWKNILQLGTENYFVHF